MTIIAGTVQSNLGFYSGGGIAQYRHADHYRQHDQ